VILQKQGEGDIKQTTGNRALHEISKKNGVGVVNVTHRKSICQEYSVADGKAQ
jgi:hypothetical protein